MKYLLCRDNATVLHALELLQRSGKGIVFVVNRENRLRGVMTDGDIRRLLLRGGKLSEHIGTVANKKFTCAKVGESREQIITRLSNTIKIIPVVNNNGRVVDYVQFDANTNLSIVSPNFSGN